MAARMEAFRGGLRDLGYIEGRNLAIDHRWADGRDEALDRLAVDLAKSEPDILVAHGVIAIIALQKAKARAPIVCLACGDLLGPGLVKSLARPAGNVTGLTVMAPEASGKRLELLRAMGPGMTRVAVLWNAANPVSGVELAETQAAGQALGLEVVSHGVKDMTDLEAAFSALRGRVHGLIVLSDAALFGSRHRVAELALVHRLPATSFSADFAHAGGLFGYGPDLVAIARRAASYVDRIAKGAKPGELPIEQPARFELVINLRTAKALGLSLPNDLLARADALIR